MTTETLTRPLDLQRFCANDLDEREPPAIFTFDGGHGLLMPFRE